MYIYLNNLKVIAKITLFSLTLLCKEHIIRVPIRITRTSKKTKPITTV